MSTTTKATEIIEKIVKILDERKAENISVLDISGLSIMADTLIIASGGNINHIHALCDYVEDICAKEKVPMSHIEGYNGGNWILMDYGDFIINIFDEESRSFYDLDHIWSDAKKIKM